MPSTAVSIDYYSQKEFGINEKAKTISFAVLAGLLHQECLTPKMDTLPKESLQLPGTFSNVRCLSFGLNGLVRWVDDAIEELNEVYNEVSEEGWDGYGAAAISYEAYIEVSKILMDIPTFLPKPEITAEPDGGIGLEWYKDKGYAYILSVNGKKTISYAGLFGPGIETHGKESFSGFLPKAIIDGLKRLYFNGYESE